MKLHSVVDCITNSSSVTYIRPLDNAVNATKDILKKLMDTMGVNGEVDDYFDVSYHINDDWYWLVFDYSLDISRDFMQRNNIDPDTYFELDYTESQSIVKKFKEEASAAFENGTLDFDFSWDDDSERNWGRWLDVIITTKSGEVLNFTDMVLSVYYPDKYED